MPTTKSGFYSEWRTINIDFPSQAGAVNYARSLQTSTGKKTRVEQKRNGHFKVMIADG